MGTRKVLVSLVLGALAVVAAVLLVVTLRAGNFARLAEGQVEGALVLDMNADNGNGPCDPIDSSISVGEGSEFKVAVCLTGGSEAPAALDLFLNNDRSLDQCVPVDCGVTDCLDTNPDANAGVTTWGTPLGTRWDCSALGVAPPSCDLNGQIYLGCFSAQPPTLPFGPAVAAPLAVISFKAIAEGTDTFSWGPNSHANGLDLAPIAECRDATACRGGSVTITAAGAPTATIASTAESGTTPASGPAATAVAATATSAASTAVAQGTPVSAINDAATATAAAAATKAATAAKATPGGKATANPTAATGGGGSSGPNAGIIAVIVVAVVVVVGGVGWFAWRRLRAG